MRVVSLVPSWTETLLAAGVDVVGRTRFCVHPRARVRDIPAVGGTKDWEFDRILALKPDLIVLDKEENPKFMAEQSAIPVLATHVTDVESVTIALGLLARELNNKDLAWMAERWRKIGAWQGLPVWQFGDDLPGVTEWGRRPKGPISKVVYVIWRNPWMAVSRETFIGSVLERCGLGPYLGQYETRYPKIELSEFSPASTLLLFSSEPYPFHRRRSVLTALEHAYAFVDGECFSWFGLRSLAFLESLQARGQTPP